MYEILEQKIIPDPFNFCFSDKVQKNGDPPQGFNDPSGVSEGNENGSPGATHVVTPEM